MKPVRNASAGTLESSDLVVQVEPCEEGIELEIESPVLLQFGAAIRRSVLETAEMLGAECARIRIFDRGALDCTIRARTETALVRASGKEEA